MLLKPELAAPVLLKEVRIGVVMRTLRLFLGSIGLYFLGLVNLLRLH